MLLSAWVPGWSQAADPVSWSLVSEAFFYALFPLLALGLARADARRARAWLVGSLLGALLAWVVVVLAPADLGRVPAMRLPEFAAGVACARLVQLGAWPPVRPRHALLVLLAGWVAASLVPGAFGGSVLTLPGFALLIGAIGAAQADGLPSRLVSGLSRPAVVRLGEWSFAFYLVHVLLMRVVEHTVVSHPAWRLLPGAMLLLGVLVVATGLAGLLHHAVEVPANTRIRRCRPAAAA